MGREVVVAITAGKLDFGPWEQIFIGEFDGGRRKRVLIKIIAEYCRMEPERFAPSAPTAIGPHNAGAVAVGLRGVVAD